MHANPLTRDQFERTLKSSAALNEIKRPATTYWKDAWRRLRSNPVAMVSMGILALIVILAIVIPFVSPYAYDQQDYMAINQGPSTGSARTPSAATSSCAAGRARACRC